MQIALEGFLVAELTQESSLPDDVAPRPCKFCARAIHLPVNMKVFTCRYDYAFGNANLFLAQDNIRLKSEFLIKTCDVMLSGPRPSRA